MSKVLDFDPEGAVDYGRSIVEVVQDELGLEYDQAIPALIAALEITRESVPPTLKAQVGEEMLKFEEVIHIYRVEECSPALDIEWREEMGKLEDEGVGDD